jgi:hypothetical protein
MNEDERWPYYFIIITPGLIFSCIIGERIFRCRESRCCRGIGVRGGSFVLWCHCEALACDLLSSFLTHVTW